MSKNLNRSIIVEPYMKDRGPMFMIAVLAVVAGLALHYQNDKLLRLIFGLGIMYLLYKVIFDRN